MKKEILFAILVGIIFLIGMGHPNGVIADVNINVGINVPPPPPLVIPAPPSVFVVPRTYVYFVPDVKVDIFFYHDYWYRPYEGRWYRSASYNGPWVYIIPKHVPLVLLHLPPDFRRVPPGHQRIPYGQLKKHWMTWENEKYWDKHEAKEWHEEKQEHKENKGKGRGKGKHGN